MPKNVDVDFDGLDDAAQLLDEIRGDFAGISKRMNDIMGNIPVACGTDHFGREFTGEGKIGSVATGGLRSKSKKEKADQLEGGKGFQASCEGALQGADAMAESFGQYSVGLGGGRGARQALSGTDKISGDNIRRTV